MPLGHEGRVSIWKWSRALGGAPAVAVVPAEVARRATEAFPPNPYGEPKCW